MTGTLSERVLAAVYTPERRLWLDPDDRDAIVADVLAVLGPDDALEARAPQVLDVIQDHRRVNNVRRCSGCDWRPVASGRNGDPDAMLARHRQFNEHLANLIVRSLAGC